MKSNPKRATSSDDVGNISIVSGLTDPMWEPTDETRYFAQVNDMRDSDFAEFSFGPTRSAAVSTLLKKMGLEE